MSNTTLALLWDSTRLRLLVELERHGSVSAAARAVGIGQPTASEHVRLLEAAAGQRLV
ncbi:MAG: helix-turn-helix domain-containing protein, partial [Gaiellaceae bacterium]